MGVIGFVTCEHGRRQIEDRVNHLLSSTGWVASVSDDGENYYIRAEKGDLRVGAVSVPRGGDSSMYGIMAVTLAHLGGYIEGKR